MKLKDLLSKIEKLKKTGNYDLSLEEDLSIAIMNLISLEEHFFLTAEKTGKDEYLKLLEEVREMRKTLLAKMIPAHEGETWCITKHLLAATMRLLEVGTKSRKKEYFDYAYKIYSLFWALRLKLIKLPQVKDTIKDQDWSLQDITSKLVDCCKE
ncbi:hypothetical protein A2634_04265 [Candidatus Amesbacteria bacterium RIFCSPHIGHO2_01_FULL_48_32]|uniref:Uncharacterized protein n=1 Tax=Candidatus Amesbacteria bacterium RIFCSPLOWO2_01_FULL_48_25 TaxID=1797259 RepID=A0A1F4ZC99_9BACT|nr:MAG: hypothetical protein A2634_04265 [Candidatus Amesbacteria bacterium RIFCSPHIGHO2_01_FULL_48_32]OGD03881.1 MAG: hypothetical protein A2989_04240 [Candidatus Amesbacteria bacterium RIFCSPLOWO2_01_FULL_48_25]HJZ05455.1 hypothetical protein [Patescibacteria group bacterium]